MCHSPSWTHCNEENYLFYREKDMNNPNTKSAQEQYQVNLKEGYSTLKKVYKYKGAQPHLDTHLKKV